MRPVSHQSGSLHPETRPWPSQTRTVQKYRVLGRSSGPSYGTRTDSSDATRPLSQTSGRASAEALVATRSW
ncbi:hypothetical protein ACIQNQ_30040 [Streptomyces werraensis]|uniref:hypothetical protein n=1 Tax=Streptomyces werraensis TaxID=68284 RepID=UPI0038041AC3